MADVELQPASDLSDEKLAALFTASYEGYLAPFTVDAAAMRALTETCDLDRAASVIAVRDGQRVGLANLGVRGSDAWVGGVGVVPTERRRGTGRRLMEALHENARSARRRAGLARGDRGEQRRDRSVRATRVRARARARGRVARGAAGGEANETDAAEAHAWIREHRVGREPWQRDDALLAKAADAPASWSPGPPRSSG